MAFDGDITLTETGSGGTGIFHEVLLVRANDLVSLSLSAGSFSSAAAYGGGSASSTVDFSHTLRWMGVENLEYDAGGGTFVDAPDDWRLTLLSDTTGFDYWNDAGPNPFTSGGVPEPAAWALMIGGFGAVGAALRRRRRAFRPVA